MKIVRSFFAGGHRYQVLRAFNFREKKGAKMRPTAVGEWVVFPEDTPAADILDLVAVGKIMPEVPPKIICRVQRGFSMRISGKVEEVKPGERVELLGADAVKLIVHGDVVPVEYGVWCPFRLTRSGLQKQMGRPAGKPIKFGIPLQK